jgi:long-subunit acyl-CoA synthetase (AMP-forming)
MALLSRNRAHWIMADMAVIHSGNVTVPLFTTHATATANISSTSRKPKSCSWVKRKTGKA